MKKIVFIILSLMFAAPESSANSLDELYRDLIRADNEGYLPLFVKNRQAPDILSDDKIPAAPKTTTTTTTPTDVPQEVSFVDPRQKEAEAAGEIDGAGVLREAEHRGPRQRAAHRAAEQRFERQQEKLLQAHAVRTREQPDEEVEK